LHVVMSSYKRHDAGAIYSAIAYASYAWRESRRYVRRVSLARVKSCIEVPRKRKSAREPRMSRRQPREARRGARGSSARASKCAVRVQPRGVPQQHAHLRGRAGAAYVI